MKAGQKEMMRARLRRQQTIASIMPSLMPSEKMDMGAHLSLTAKGEYMVTAVDPGSPADLEGIPLNSVILAIDGEPLQGKAREEISDMMRHFVGTRMNVHMKMPNVSDDSHAVTRMVYLHKKGDRSEFFGPLSMPDIRQGLSSGQTESQSDVTDNDDTTLEEEDDEGFIGLSISHTKPHHVTHVDFLLDKFGRKQGEKGYTNVAVHPEDVLMSVDGIDIEAKSVMQIHALIRGRNHSTVNLTLERHVTRKPYTVCIQRHKRILAPQTPRLTPRTLSANVKAMLMASQSSPETSKNANPAFVGLEITTERPYKVLSVDDLLDEALIGQGQPGYSNPDVYPGDVLVQVDRRSVEDVGLGQVLKALQGPLGTVAVLTFLRPTSDAQLVVRALRHKQHPAGSNWLQWKQPASETHEPSLRTSLGFDSLFKWSDEMRLQDVSRQSMENRRSRQEVWGDRRESRDIRKVVDDSWTQESGVRNSVATRESSTLNSTYEVFTQHQEKATLDQRREKQNVDDMIALHTIPKPTLDQQMQKQNIDMIALHTGSYSRHGPVARSGNEAGTIKFTGIGCVLTHMSDGAIFIQEIRHGGGCYEAGVPVGSQLLSVDGVPVTDMPIEKIRNLCLGPTGSVSVLTIIPPSSGREGFANSKQDVTWQEIKVYRGAKVVEANGPRMPVTVSSPQYDSRQKSSSPRDVVDRILHRNSVSREDAEAVLHRKSWPDNTCEGNIRNDEEAHLHCPECHAFVPERVLSSRNSVGKLNAPGGELGTERLSFNRDAVLSKDAPAYSARYTDTRNSRTDINHDNLFLYSSTYRSHLSAQADVLSGKHMRQQQLAYEFDRQHYHACINGNCTCSRERLGDLLTDLEKSLSYLEMPTTSANLASSSNANAEYV